EHKRKRRGKDPLHSVPLKNCRFGIADLRLPICDFLIADWLIEITSSKSEIGNLKSQISNHKSSIVQLFLFCSARKQYRANHSDQQQQRSNFKRQSCLPIKLLPYFLCILCYVKPGSGRHSFGAVRRFCSSNSGFSWAESYLRG